MASDDHLNAGIVRVISPTEIGTGFVVSDTGLVATCSHVVQSEESQLRGEPRPERVSIVFFANGQERVARVVPEWWRPANGDDIALLQLEGTLTAEIRVLSLGSSNKSKKAKSFGFPRPGEGFANVDVLGKATIFNQKRRLQLSSEQITGGFSGAPLWDESSGFVIGMIAEILKPDQYGRMGETAYAVPSEILHEICPELKLEIIQDLTVPLWNRLLPAPNPNFTGRTQILAELEATLTSQEPGAWKVALTGLGGIGKTQIAIEYVHRHRSKFQLIWWLRSDEPISLAADYAEMAGALNLPEKGSPERRVVVEAARRWLEHNSRWLLIFDNVREPKDLQEYLPRTGGGHVIMTSRNPNWGGMAKALPIKVFERDESVEFLLKRSGQDDEETAGQLAEDLGDLPLALEQAGAYIEERGITLVGYRNRFREQRNTVLERGQPADYPDTVATTWDISFQAAQEESAPAADLLYLFSFLAPEDIPRSILIEGAQHLPKSLESAVADQTVLDDAVAALRRYSLITASGDMFGVHRLVQAVTQDKLQEDLQKIWLVDSAFPVESDDVRTWERCSLLLPHALAAAGHAERLWVAPEVVGYLLNLAGIYLRGLAEFQEAKKYLERALQIDEEVYGPDHPNVARDVNSLGLVLQDLGDLQGAKKYLERALQIDEKVYSPDHPVVAIRVNNLGLVLHDLGDLEEAKKCYERALEIVRAGLGEEHPHTKRVLENLKSLQPRK